MNGDINVLCSYTCNYNMDNVKKKKRIMNLGVCFLQYIPLLVHIYLLLVCQ